MHKIFLLEGLKEGDPFKDLGADGRIIFIEGLNRTDVCETHSVCSCNYGDEFRVSFQLQKFLNSLETVFQEVGLKAHGM
jgi:hypothetical protein